MPDAPPWAARDAHGRSLLHIALQTADGAALPLVARGSELPARGSALLTTAAHGVASLQLWVLVGTRLPAAANRRVHKRALVARVECAAARGLAQLRVAIEATETEIRVAAQDMLTRAAASWTLTAADVPEDGEGDAPAAGALPAEWRYEAVYADALHMVR